MARAVSTTITEPNGTPREGLQVAFHADPPAVPVHVVTDAGGVFVAELEPGVTYRVPSSNAFTVNGVSFPAGMMFVVEVPEGEGPVDLAEVTVGVQDMSAPAIDARLRALEAAVLLPSPDPEPAPDAPQAPETNEGAAS